MNAKVIKPCPVNPDSVFPAVEKMLYKRAWDFTNRYGIPFEETKAEAYWAFVKACDDWNTLRGWERGSAFSSWCYFGVSMKLLNMVKERATHSTRFPSVEIEEELCGYAPPDRSEVLDLVSDLPADAREIVHLLLEVPAEVLGLSITPRQLLRRVKDHLIEVQGKSKQQVEEACQLLRNRFQEAQ